MSVDTTLISVDINWPANCIVTEDYGLLTGGLRYESPDIAAEAVSGGLVQNGWDFWAVKPANGDPVTLKALLSQNHLVRGQAR